jgi:hypothetical protein
MFTLAELEDVILLVRSSVPPTPQYAWPLLKAQTSVEVDETLAKDSHAMTLGSLWIRFAGPAMVGGWTEIGLASELLWPGAALAQLRNRSPGSALARHCRRALAVI